MTSHQPPRPQPGAATGNGINEETLHLPTVTVTGAPPRTAPSPYPARPAFRAPASPPSTEAQRNLPPTAAPQPRQRTAERWEGVGFRADIQGLRAVAVVLVLLSHAGFAFAAGGYVGVDVFFVLSGFLITSLLVKEVFDTGKISIAGFYARRARRILPVAGAVTVATVVGAWLWLPATRLEAVMQDAFTTVVYVVNYRFIAEQTEYLNADQSPSPFQQFWSLAVEEQFYLLWPLLLLGLLLLVKRAPRRLVNAGIGLTISVFAVSLVLSVLVTEQSRATAYYAAHTRAWELAAGALLALTLPTLKRTPKILGWVLGIVGLTAIVLAGAMYTAETPFPGYTALLPVAGTMLVLIAGSGAGGNPVSALLSTGPFQFFGKISYSLYLWHWPVLILIPLAVDAEPSILLNVTLLIGTVGIAQVSYLCIEAPIRNARPLKLHPLYGITTGLACSLLGLATIIALTTVFSKVPADEPRVDLDAIAEVEDLSEIERRLQAGLETTDVPAGLEPSVLGAEDDKPQPYYDGCHLNYEKTALPDGCEYGQSEGATTIMLVGDSHAAQWFPALEAIADREGWRLISRTKSACTPVSVAVELPDSGEEYTACAEWRGEVFEEIAEVQPALVVFGASDRAELMEIDGESTIDLWQDGWSATLGNVPDAVETAVIADTPYSLNGSGPECLSLNTSSVQECNDLYKVEFPARRAATMAAAGVSESLLVDPAQWFCRDDRCPVIVDELLVYRDNHHMSTPYSKSLASVLQQVLPDL